MPKQIESTNGKVFIVDDGDYSMLAGISWSAMRGGNSFYAISGGRSMHRMIMDAKDDDEVDHVDGNGLNNQRVNLRICSHAQNMQNRAKHKNGGTSQYKGVYWDKFEKRFVAQCRIGGKKHRKRFKNEIDAAKAYNEMAIKLYGEFARLNVIEERGS